VQWRRSPVAGGAVFSVNYMDSISELFGGAERIRTRPRGFAPWSPRQETLELLARVNAVLGEYRDHLPLTLRQIFYRLVGAHGYEKTERAYERLGEHLVRARRARIIPMEAIRDDGGSTITPNMWASAEEYLDAVRSQAGGLMLDRTEGQKTRLAVLCEAAGMGPQLGRIVEPFGVTVMSSGGFDSVTEKHAFAVELARHDRPTEVLSIGDQDGSGVWMFAAYLEDVEAFTRDLGGEATFTRLAVTPEQVREFNLPTAPPKPTDRRAFHGQTCQAEALAPDVLASILRDAIEARIDRRALDRVLRRERAVRHELMARLSP
jgi:hypothetical protein